ncbi:glycosyltransferase family 2 protein [Flavobacterium hiemivividum]|uniref:Glycosyltransferase family 2 protein n=1 Tax=Flavobacterium hiemivividum TaxID=2541734 RepID=A0A4R5CYG9_9FLAO|nr:glycosyltransferase family 2 protein [Flavobacterium hiemivividum]TDE04580.1 glycosyltransferase family 2 protein [Flavobacterium hiemivividum]
MQQPPKISIIIPVYNREDLLGYTLDSILGQTFNDWECILVDDQSSDDSYEVMESYQEKDNRFKIYKRPNELKKGANACRNFGFTKSMGYYIKWFDSDDIMLPNHLEVGYNALIRDDFDFVITDTINFNHETGVLLDKPYDFDRKAAKISAMNFASNKLGWITDDFFVGRKLVENLRFNENITTDGDEYNFFVRLLNLSTKGLLIDQILTHRRVHNSTLTKIHGIKNISYITKIANIKYQTANDLLVYNNAKLVRWFMSGYMKSAFDIAVAKKEIPNQKEAMKLIRQYFSFSKSMAFLIALFLGFHFKKGYKIMKYARR